MKNNKKTQGKKNRAAGTRFELKVRKDLEDKGWVVSKWMNQVVFEDGKKLNIKHQFDGTEHLNEETIEKIRIGKLIPAKHKFRGPGIPMAIGTGFPDFIAYSFFVEKIEEDLNIKCEGISSTMHPDIFGVECKSNGYLDKEEREKCKWLLENNIFSKILIASKGEKRGEIKYKEVKNGRIDTKSNS